MGSSTDPCYIQNRVITNRIIKRLRCISLLMIVNDAAVAAVAFISHVTLVNDATFALVNVAAVEVVNIAAVEVFNLSVPAVAVNNAVALITD